MNKIEYSVKGNLLGVHSAAHILAGEHPLDALVEDVVQTIATDVMVTVSGVTMHLAAWSDPDHWSEDWVLAGVKDVDALLSGAVTSE